MKNKNVIFVIASLLALIVGLSFLLNTPQRKAKILIRAIEEENYNKTQNLLDKGVDPNVTTASDITEFILNLVESTGQRPLSVACEVGNLEIVKLLIDYGATAEPYDKCGWSPLKETLFYYQSDDKVIVEMLLENGADINENNNYELPIFTAAEMIPKKYNGKQNNKVHYIGDYDAEVAKGITDIVELLLEYGNYDVNLKSSYNGATLLISATRSGNLQLVEFLLSKGCNVAEKDNANKTALDYAEYNRDAEMITLLTTQIGTGDGSLS